MSSVLIAAVCVAAQAQKWTTFFAYNNVEQIALGNECVYALSDGSLFSVDKSTEQIRIYNNGSGLHGTGITAIHYDKTSQSLLIGYKNGKIDLLSKNGVQYIGELYDKDMTQQKTIYNITIDKTTAYLSTHYGIQTMDMRSRKLVDSYWLLPGGKEKPISDVRISGDSIYAYDADSLFCAGMKDNLVDYRVWKREKGHRVAPDEEKGKHYHDGTSHWYAGHGEGIVRFTSTSRITYKPQGPVTNESYYVSAVGGQVFMLAGGRWTSQYGKQGHVMRYRGNSWYTILADSIRAQSGVAKVRDMMNIAVDPQDENHYFATSYGTGLYEFRGDRCVGHTTANGVIESALPNSADEYTRLLGAHFDRQGRLWMLNAGSVANQVVVKDGEEYKGIPLTIDGQLMQIEIPADLIIDRRNEHLKWIGIAYKNTGVITLDDNGTIDSSDDRVCYHSQWLNRQGRTFKPNNIFAMMQDSKGRIWLATDQGAAYIDEETDAFQSEMIVQPEVMDGNGENPITTLRVTALCQTPDGHIWVGTETLGVYELDEDATEILAHYTTDNSAMSANGILSLSSNEDGCVWIGTSEGLVKYDPKGNDESLKAAEETSGDEDKGSMLLWQLHLSYSNAQEITASNSHIYAVANGALFSIDRADNRLECLSKSTGLSGTGVSHIAYDKGAERLIVAYENGQIDIVEEDGSVIPMPDLSMKAGSMAVNINSIAVGSRNSYLAMPFGVIALQPRKAEVSETYYIGENAGSVEVQQIVEMGDSLYAFSYDRMYKAALKDNLVDFSFWQQEEIPFEEVQQAAVYEDKIYVLAHDTLYRREGKGWKQVLAEPMKWMHVSGGQLLGYRQNKGLLRLGEEDATVWLSDTYVAADAVYSNGEYWLAEEGKGVVRLSTAGDERYEAEGPLSNFGYRLQIAHDRLYVAPGGRWAEQFGRQSSLSIYDGQQWKGIPWPDTWYYTGHDIRDAVSYAIDAADPGHFYVATYGTGVFEFKNYKAVAHYDSSNSSLRKVTADASDYYYTRTDGAMWDEDGNLWVMNSTERGEPLHIRTPYGQWTGLKLKYQGSEIEPLKTPFGIYVDKRNKNLKWMMDQRETPRLILLNDGGTPTYTGDDKCMVRSSLVDQNGNVLTPTQFRCIEQDHTNRIWIGTDKGVLLLSKESDFFSSNVCERIIIPRNDGTKLGDYLLGDEQINCLAVDGGNRMWIGTANSGLYLIEDDTITVAHFTENNSLLPSNTIQSIAIMPKTGEVFVGTANGIASYRADASEPQEDLKQAYAFPNPVRPNYGGMISVAGLMENTVVNIVDESGNLVCKTKSHGGMAVWDGKTQSGKRAKGGVYTALCNAPDGSRTVVKILVIR